MTALAWPWSSSAWSTRGRPASCSPRIRSPVEGVERSSTRPQGWATPSCRARSIPTTTRSTPIRVRSTSTSSGEARPSSAMPRCLSSPRSGVRSKTHSAPRRTSSSRSTPPVICGSSRPARSRRCSRSPSVRRATQACVCISRRASRRAISSRSLRWAPSRSLSSARRSQALLRVLAATRNRPRHQSSCRAGASGPT